MTEYPLARLKPDLKTRIRAEMLHPPDPVAKIETDLWKSAKRIFQAFLVLRTEIRILKLEVRIAPLETRIARMQLLRVCQQAQEMLSPPRHEDA